MPMPIPSASATVTGTKPSAVLARRLIGRWWRRQSPARQDRFATLGPLVSVLLFLAAIISAFWYLRNEELERESAMVRRDTEIAQQQIRMRLIENQEALVRIVRELVTRELDIAEFNSQAAEYVGERPEVIQIWWFDSQRKRRGGYSAIEVQERSSAKPLLRLGDRRDRSEPDRAASGPLTIKPAPLAPDFEWAFIAARDTRQPAYTRVYKEAGAVPVFQLHVPMLHRTGFAGTVVVEYSVEALLRHYVPAELTRRHAIELLDEREQTIASTVSSPAGKINPRSALMYELALAPVNNGLILRGSGTRTSAGLVGNTLFWMVVALSILTVWMLLGTWRHMRRRSQIQSALVQETNFRRAMENSMLTGMRAMDMDGRITYVNAAFCGMTGFAEGELIGLLPPYPYWPNDRVEENTRLLQLELQGRSPAGGIEVKVARKDGALFDARMYVSPLVDARGQQTGWMTSMTNITEAKRIRDQLSASHERFTTVLEGLDAAVSVLSVQQGELLFANRSYRLWFGADADGHSQLASGSATTLPFVPNSNDPIDMLSGLPAHELTESGADTREVYAESLNKWFDVRSRYLQWTDGRLAQMLIATDVTARRRVEQQAAQQAEKAQESSRLITMGEMASSVAHELNQPLTAITNYCNGMVSRVRGGSIGREDLVEALQKTARQAERAGQIIHRIRSFVRKSGPQRQAAGAREIVDDALELASIELRRRNVAIHNYVAQRLPQLQVDPILIEQVLLNLIRNSAEAIDNAQLPASRRHIELRVVPRHNREEGGVIEFSVSDMGPGLPETVIERLYEAFFSTKAEGMGIGLSLCRSIVESHHGRIRAQNIYNASLVVGCRFSFTLPVETHARTEPGLLQPAADTDTAVTTSP
jgi:PAS domain S-box-containing protein